MNDKHNSISPKYTFLLPAYKGKYLGEMLDSIQSQNYTDFEVVISDDCSPEDLFSIVSPYLNDARFHYRRNDANIGSLCLVDHWNKLLASAHSDFIIMASDDDFYDPYYLLKMDALIDTFPDIDVFRPLISINQQNLGECWKDDIVCSNNKLLTHLQFERLKLTNRVFSGISQFIFRKDALDAIGGFVNLPYAWFSDDATVSELAKNKGIAICPEFLFVSRVWNNSISGNNDLRVNLLKCKAASKYFDLYSHYSDLDKEVRTLVISRIRNVSAEPFLFLHPDKLLPVLQQMTTINSVLFSPFWCCSFFFGRLSSFLKSKIKHLIGYSPSRK